MNEYRVITIVVLRKFYIYMERERERLSIDCNNGYAICCHM